MDMLIFVDSPVVGDFFTVLTPRQGATVTGIWAGVLRWPALIDPTKPTNYCRCDSFAVYLPKNCQNVWS
jgi:hypothetical protein